MNNSINILKIVILSMLTIILVSFLILLLNSDIKFNFKTKPSKLVYNQNIVEQFNKIDIDTRSLDIKFLKSEDDTVNVKVYDKDDNDLSVKVENDTLKVSSQKKNVCMFFCFSNKREVIISLPQREYDLLVNSTSGDITSKIDFNNLKIGSKSGDVTLQKVGNAEIKVTSGDIKVENANNLVIDSTSGDLILGNIYDSVKLETTSGDIRIDNITLTSDSSIKVTSGDVKINNASENIYFNTKVKSGDVKISNNNRKAEYELSIRTTSGDIIVKN